MKRLVSFVFLFLFIGHTSFAFAQDLLLEFDPDEYVSSDPAADMTEGNLSSSDVTMDVEVDTNPYLFGYQELFRFNQEELFGLKAVLMPLREDMSQIDTQLQVLSQQMDRVRQLELLMDQKMQSLLSLDTRLSVQEQLLSLEMKDVMKKFERILVLFLRIKRQFVSEEGDIHFTQLFTSAGSPQDLLLQDFLLKRVQDQILDQIQLVAEKQFQLDQLRASLFFVQEQLDLYQEKISSSSLIIDQQLAYQQQLYLQKQQEEQFFQQRLADALEEQEFVSLRIREIATGVYSKDFQGFPSESFIWPVAPVLGISAYFHDQAYRARFGIDHSAIDIPTDQLTSVKAPLSGEVLEVHDGGLGYSYLQLGHRDGLSTVYGHIYSIKVSLGDSVQQGQVIALSGGALGTKGAGSLTTGPHLHFEVLKDGKHVDPLDYLPNLE